MRNYDLSPLLHATVGFDRMFNMLDTATRLDQGAPSYPPYNIEKAGEDAYRIVMAVAGFGEADLEVTAKENSLVVVGKQGKNPEGQKYLRRVAGRHGKSKALSILAAKLGRTVYFMLAKDRAFDMKRFLARHN